MTQSTTPAPSPTAFAPMAATMRIVCDTPAMAPSAAGTATAVMAIPTMTSALLLAPKVNQAVREYFKAK